MGKGKRMSRKREGVLERDRNRDRETVVGMERGREGRERERPHMYLQLFFRTHVHDFMCVSMPVCCFE